MNIDELKKKNGYTLCRQCGGTVIRGTAFCSGCGNKVPELWPEHYLTICEQCGAAVPSDVAFCSSCGHPVRSDELAEAPIPDGMHKCDVCGAIIADRADVCPSCGATKPKAKPGCLDQLALLCAMVAYFIIVGDGISKSAGARTSSASTAIAYALILVPLLWTLVCIELAEKKNLDPAPLKKTRNVLAGMLVLAPFLGRVVLIIM